MRRPFLFSGQLFIKAGFLLGVYLLHLVFFQNLMLQHNSESAQQFHHFFAHKSKRNPHTPATDYSQLLKFESKFERTKVAVPVFAEYQIAQLFVFFKQQHCAVGCLPPVFCNLTSKLFKRYSLLRIFRI